MRELRTVLLCCFKLETVVPTTNDVLSTRFVVLENKTRTPQPGSAPNLLPTSWDGMLCPVPSIFSPARLLAFKARRPKHWAPHLPGSVSKPFLCPPRGARPTAFLPLPQPGLLDSSQDGALWGHRFKMTEYNGALRRRLCPRQPSVCRWLILAGTPHS